MEKLNENEKERLVEKVVSEYQAFLKETDEMVQEVKRTTILSLGKLLDLKDGDTVLINPNGTVDVERFEENSMASEKEKVTLNGREVTSDELERQKEIAKNQKGAKLEEVSKNNYRLHFKD